MQPHVDEIRGHIEQQRPVHRIRNYQRHIVLPQQPHKLLARKALISNLDRMPDLRLALYT